MRAQAVNPDTDGMPNNTIVLIIFVVVALVLLGICARKFFYLNVRFFSSTRSFYLSWIELV